MSIKKILHITFDMNIAGTEQVIRQIIENTDTERFSPIVLCIDGTVGPLGKKLIDSGIEVLCLTRKPGLDLRLVKDIAAILEKQAIDIAHCHQYTPYIYGLLATLKTRTKVIFTEHGRFYPDTRKWKRFICNPMLSLFTHSITAISAATAESLVEIENFPRKKIQVIYNGISDVAKLDIDTSQLSLMLEIPKNHKIVGTISRLDPIKNQEMMLRAFKDVLKEEPNTTLLIVGDGPIRRDLEELSRSLCVERNVIFTGFKVDPQQYLKIMDVFLLSSLSEGTSMTLLEAMAFSKASVVTDVGGNPEIVNDREQALLIQNKDTKAFSEAIIELLFDTPTRNKLGVAARKRYEEIFTVDKMAQSYQALYSRAAS